MNYFWIVAAIFVLPYVLFRIIRASNRHGAVRNAFLAKYTYDQLTEDQQSQVREQAEQIRTRGGGGTPLSDLNDMLRFSFYAYGMLELGIPPALRGEEKWDYVRNPFLALHGAESHMRVVKNHLEHKYKVSIDLKTPKEALQEMWNKRKSDITENSQNMEADITWKWRSKRWIIGYLVFLVVACSGSEIISRLSNTEIQDDTSSSFIGFILMIFLIWCAVKDRGNRTILEKVFWGVELWMVLGIVTVCVGIVIGVLGIFDTAYLHRISALISSSIILYFAMRRSTVFVEQLI